MKDHHKNTVTIRDGITRGNPNQVIIDEAGLYSLVLRSKLPAAEAFQEWVVAEVIPSIRKTGSYSVNQDIKAKEVAAIANEIKKERESSSKVVLFMDKSSRRCYDQGYKLGLMLGNKF